MNQNKSNRSYNNNVSKYHQRKNYLTSTGGIRERASVFTRFTIWSKDSSFKFFLFTRVRSLSCSSVPSWLAFKTCMHETFLDSKKSKKLNVLSYLEDNCIINTFIVANFYTFLPFFGPILQADVIVWPQENIGIQHAQHRQHEHHHSHHLKEMLKLPFERSNNAADAPEK